MKERTINIVFPKPVYSAKLDREFTNEENDFFGSIKNQVVNNAGNLSSLETYVLENPALLNLKSELMLCINDFIESVLCYDTTLVTPYITQSWLNYTSSGQYHHKHTHANSVVSGVLYIDADLENDKIFFFNDEYRQIKPKTSEWNMYNSESWYFPIEKGNIVLFESNLSHEVRTKVGQNTRTSLAFNVFLKGTIGIHRELTELKL